MTLMNLILSKCVEVGQQRNKAQVRQSADKSNVLYVVDYETIMEKREMNILNNNGMIMSH